jgi:hypothetical protein
MARHGTFDRAAWFVQVGAGDPVRIETSNCSTWALRALMAAGEEGLHPIDTGGGRWAHLVDRLRELGLPIDDLPDNEGGRRGYRLVATVRPVRGAE